MKSEISKQGTAKSSGPETPLFVLRPNIAVAIIPIILGSIIGGLLFGALAGGFSRSIIVGVITGGVLMLLFLFLRLMNLNARRYVFYKAKAEFYEGFLNIVQRTVQYNKITDCVLTKSVWDRLFGTGTIRLITAGHMAGYQGSYAANLGGGLVLQYISNPDQIYQKLQKMTE